MGTIIPRDADQQKEFCIPLKKEEVAKGDLVFFPGHVGFYLEDGLILHSNLGLGGVTYSNIFSPSTSYEDYLSSNITGYGRTQEK
jgi:cell wall-associated NlpC family hydrolase